MCYAISREVYKNYLHGRRRSQAVADGEHPPGGRMAVLIIGVTEINTRWQGTTLG